jgi:hypothetical protein
MYWQRLKQTYTTTYWVAHHYGNMMAYELSSKEEILSFQATCKSIMYLNMWKQYRHIMFYDDCPSDEALTFSDKSPDWSKQG